ncbi:hypothetical protein HHK36_013378 [Tetracentron sinense]|uniref:Outer envelope pore protein 37, chloroplastic n=1 Tax=Tetracentron sinense TaxID=13715 RepID=A0A835DFD1_TETSI|nr:hypothetical protein HHK36_013378 [Tetracentron sinense]
MVEASPANPNSAMVDANPPNSAMVEASPANPNSLEPAAEPCPPASKYPRSPGFSFPRPAIRLTSEFDSDSSIFFHKISCKLFDSLAKLKLSFQNNNKGEISDPRLGFTTKYLSLQYDLEEQNALVNASFNVGSRLQFRATQDVKGQECLKGDVWTRLHNWIQDIGGLIREDFVQAQQGEVAMVASLADPSYKFELLSAVPSIGLPKATFRFPLGEVSLEEREEEEKRALSINGILKGQVLNGVCTAMYKNEELNLRYLYKDEEMSFIPSISLPSNALSFAFKRRFGPSDKLSYWYNFDSSYWSTVYKHTVGKDIKLKAGYDSEVGDENGQAKTAPMKMKVQLMLQVPQDDINGSVFMFRVKKRWDF